MTQRHLQRAFLILWWTLGVLLLIGSIQTALHGRGTGPGRGDIHAVVLGSVEAIAAVLFLFRRTMRVGGAGLLVTFVIAFIIHATRGQFAASLLIYAASVFFAVVHGPVSMRSQI